MWILLFIPLTLFAICNAALSREAYCSYCTLTVHAGLVEGGGSVQRRVDLCPVGEQDLHALYAPGGTGIAERRAAVNVSCIYLQCQWQTFVMHDDILWKKRKGEKCLPLRSNQKDLWLPLAELLWLRGRSTKSWERRKQQPYFQNLHVTNSQLLGENFREGLLITPLITKAFCWLLEIKQNTGLYGPLILEQLGSTSALLV